MNRDQWIGIYKETLSPHINTAQTKDQLDSMLQTLAEQSYDNLVESGFDKDCPPVGAALITKESFIVASTEIVDTWPV